MAASQNSENAVAGMSKLLREIDRHSCKLASLTKAIDQLEATQGQQITRSQTLLDRAQGDNRGSLRLLALGFLNCLSVQTPFLLLSRIFIRGSKERVEHEVTHSASFGLRKLD